MAVGKSQLPFAVAVPTLVFVTVTARGDAGASANLVPNQSAEEINERRKPGQKQSGGARCIGQRQDSAVRREFPLTGESGKKDEVRGNAVVTITSPDSGPWLAAMSKR
jgi:hypothetical protein